VAEVAAEYEAIRIERTTREQIVARAAVYDVRAVLVGYVIVAAATVQNIVAVSSIDDIVAVTGGDSVIETRPRN